MHWPSEKCFVWSVPTPFLSIITSFWHLSLVDSYQGVFGLSNGSLIHLYIRWKQSKKEKVFLCLFSWIIQPKLIFLSFPLISSVEDNKGHILTHGLEEAPSTAHQAGSTIPERRRHYHFTSHLQQFIHTSIYETPMTVTWLPSASHVLSRCESLAEVKCWRIFPQVIQRNSETATEQTNCNSCLPFTIVRYSIAWITGKLH